MLRAILKKFSGWWVIPSSSLYSLLLHFTGSACNWSRLTYVRCFIFKLFPNESQNIAVNWWCHTVFYLSDARQAIVGHWLLLMLRAIVWRLSVLVELAPSVSLRCRAGIRTLCPLYSGCGRTLGLLCAWNRVAALVRFFCFVLLLIFRCVHSAVTPGESIDLGYVAMEH